MKNIENKIFEDIFFTLSRNEFILKGEAVKLSDCVERRLHQKNVKKVIQGKVHWDKEDFELPYLQWAKAYAILVSNYPNAQIEFERFDRGEGGCYDVMYYPNQTASVHCTITIEGIKRSMWYPITDFKNQAIPNPDARAINDSKMRCMVKCMALFGLGIDLYDGSFETDNIIVDTTKNEEDKEDNKKPKLEEVK